MDRFFTVTTCDRCNSPLIPIRIMSWFTTETICEKCSTEEEIIKSKLRENGIQNAMEGCGYIPKVQK